MAAFVTLQEAGKIRHYGVSNFDIDDMVELWSVPGGAGCATDQVLYNLAHRGIEWDLLPWLREHRVPVMAYFPLDHGRLVRDPKLVRFAERHGTTPARVALAWLLAHEDVIAIPKAARRERLKEDVAALSVRLTLEQLTELDALFRRRMVPFRWKSTERQRA